MISSSQPDLTFCPATLTASSAEAQKRFSWKPGTSYGSPARTAAVLAGLPYEVPGFQLNRFCASALEAVNVAGQKVRSGWEELIMAGGVESMSRCAMGSDGGPWYLDPETNYDTSFVPQGVS